MFWMLEFWFLQIHWLKPVIFCYFSFFFIKIHIHYKNLCKYSKFLIYLKFFCGQTPFSKTPFCVKTLVTSSIPFMHLFLSNEKQKKSTIYAIIVSTHYFHHYHSLLIWVHILLILKNFYTFYLEKTCKMFCIHFWPNLNLLCGF